MSLSPSSLLSLEELKEELRVKDNGKDPALRTLANTVTDVIEAHLGRQIVTRGELTEFHSMEHDGKDLRAAVLVTLESPILAVATINEKGALLTDGTDYQVSKPAGRIHRLASGAASTWAAGFRGVRVVYSAGYANTAAVPERIKAVARRLAALIWEESSRDIRGASAISDQLGNLTRFTAATLTRDMVADLAFERRRRIFETGERDQ